MGRPQLVSREEIIAAAREVFVREGLSASIRDVAAVAGISEAAIFKRFSTKAALIVAAMAPPPPDIPRLLAPLDGADLRTGLAGDDGEHRRLFPRAPAAGAADHLPARCRVSPPMSTSSATTPPASSTLRSPRRLASRVNAGHLRRLQPFAIAGIVLATAHSLALFEMMGIHGGRSPPEVIRNMVDALWFGVAP